GSSWDHVLLDPESKLVVSLVVGRRDADTVVQVFTAFYGRTGGEVPELIFTGEEAGDATVILRPYGGWRGGLWVSPAEDKAGRRSGRTAFYFPVEIPYATVHKEKEGGRVGTGTQALVLGSEEQLEQTWAESGQAQAVNTSFVERSHGTQRHFQARKKRKAYTF